MTGTNPVIALKPQVGKYVTVTRVAVSGTSFTFYISCQSSTAVSVDYWIFDVMQNAIKDPTLSTAGAQVFDEYGVMTWDAAYSAMRIVGAYNTNPPLTNNQSQDTYTNVTVPSGKTYAVIQSLLMYVPTQYDTGNYANTPNPPEEYPMDGTETTPPPGTTYRFQRLESYRSALGFSSSSNIRVGVGMYEYWEDWYSVSQLPSSAKYGQCTHIIVDVTNFVGGSGGSGTTVTGSVSSTSVTSSGTSPIISPTVTLTPSGGVSPYTVTWEYVSGSTAPTNYTALSSTSFRLQSSGQAAGSTRQTVWRARIVDSNNVVGYGPNVTFTFNRVASDVTPDALNWTNISASVTSQSVAPTSNTQTISGIDAPITIRATMSNLSNSLSAGSSWAIYVNGARANTASFSNGASVEYTVNAGDTVYFRVDAGTANSAAQSSMSALITVQNVTASSVTLDTFTMNVSTNVPDTTPDSFAWDNISNTTTSMTSDVLNNGRNVLGVNRPIVIRAYISGVTNTGSIASGSELQMYVNGTMVYGSSGVGDGYWAGYTVNSGDVVRFGAKLVAGNATAQASTSYTVTVRNYTNNSVDPLGEILATFTVNQTANVADVTPNSMTFPDQIWSTANESVNGAYTTAGPTVSGINRSVTLRFTVTSISSNLTAGTWFVANIQGSTHPRLMPDTGLYINSYYDFEVTEGTNLTYKMNAITNDGTRSASGVMTVTNLETNTVLGTFNFGVTVDSDNSSDVTPNAISFSNHSGVTNDNSLMTAGAFYQVTGISQPITIKVEVLSVSGNLDSWQQVVYYNPPGVASSGGGWTNASTTTSSEFTLTNNQWFYVRSSGSTSSGRKTGSWTTRITNVTTGAILGTFTTNLTVDDDDNYNVVDITPDPFTLEKFTVSSNEHDTLFNGTPVQIKGINQPINVRFERYISGTQPSGLTLVFVLRKASSSAGPWTTVGNMADNGSYHYIDTTAVNNDWFRLDVRGISSKGMKTVTFTTSVWNLTAGVNLSNVTGNTLTVDADDNYNYDQTPNALDWTNINFSATGQTGMGVTNSLTIGGIERPVVLRATMSVTTNQFASGSSWAIYVNNVRVYSSVVSQGSWVEYTVNSGDVVHFRMDATTTEGRRDHSSTVTVTNRSVTGFPTVDTFTITGTVDSDNNYMNDVVPNAVNWANISGENNNNSFYLTNAAQTIAGIDKPIILKATISNVSKTSNISASSRLDFQRNDAYVSDTGGIVNGYSVQAEVTSGQTVRFVAHVGTTGGRGTVSYTVTVTNVTAGNAVIDTFTVNQVVDADNLPPTVTVDMTSVSGHAFAMPGNTATAEAYGVTATVTGGAAPLSYVIEKVSGTTFITGGTTSPFFQYTGTAPFNVSGVYRLKVTDAIGRSAYSPNITVQISASNTVD